MTKAERKRWCNMKEVAEYFSRRTNDFKVGTQEYSLWCARYAVLECALNYIDCGDDELFFDIITDSAPWEEGG